MLEQMRPDEAEHPPGRSRRDTGTAAAPEASAAFPADISLEAVACELREQGLGFKEIALQLGVYTAQARALCRQQDGAGDVRRPDRRTGRKPATGLSRRALRVLLEGSHASVGGGSLRERMRHLPQIAASWRRAELLAEAGIGSATIAEIELWLVSLGLHFLGADWPQR